jgi:hypothetical protein
MPESEAESLNAAIFQRLHPRIYLERFLEENVRSDGRSFDTWRDVSINVGEYTNTVNTADADSSKDQYLPLMARLSFVSETPPSFAV